ncbi:MAG TPA: efflux RND transporter periplasmic adaptor subunit [Gemmatimonadales bacterium]|nr:efflux RND transporter periplasmic adaptor subunit [Gemmatimonadales bacterium]
MRATTKRFLLLAGLSLAAACGGREEAPAAELGAAAPAAEETFTVADTTISAVVEAAGVAGPLQRAVLATRLTGSVVSVRVREGERVRRGQVLARVDASDIEARRAQVRARITEAEAIHRDAVTQAERFRALYADEAATKAQLEAAETGLARAEAGLRAARAGEAELEAVGAYAEIRAPFAGAVVQRSVDPGAFVAPGQPIATVEDASRLRISVTVAPLLARRLEPGDSIRATIEGVPASAVVEGVVPSATALYTVNALVDNAAGKYLAGSAATLAIPEGERRALLVPEGALVREGDLTGVRVKGASGFELRWVRIGRRLDDRVEVLAGLRAGEQVLLPAVEETE